MKKSLALALLGCVGLCSSASAITFPSLTTIYVGTAVRDTGGVDFSGTTTVFHCSNVSGLSAQIRFLVLGGTGSVAGSPTTVAHGVTYAVSTKVQGAYTADHSLNTGLVDEGVVNIESTQSGVFCRGVTIKAGIVDPEGVPLFLVRVNPHPGTVE